MKPLRCGLGSHRVRWVVSTYRILTVLLWCAMDPINKNPLYVSINIPAPWIRHGLLILIADWRWWRICAEIKRQRDAPFWKSTDHWELGARSSQSSVFSQSLRLRCGLLQPLWAQSLHVRRAQWWRGAVKENSFASPTGESHTQQKGLAYIRIIRSWFHP